MLLGLSAAEVALHRDVLEWIAVRTSAVRHRATQRFQAQGRAAPDPHPALRATFSRREKEAKPLFSRWEKQASASLPPAGRSKPEPLSPREMGWGEGMAPHHGRRRRSPAPRQARGSPPASHFGIEQKAHTLACSRLGLDTTDHPP
ncbi:hypothetical protein NC00_00680 [Xanthomonas cannabis pv. phaseoli]|uniref:Uncharacterized protein n=1 Tax=Xanthomonas cannabis pv. phaseoli TaxID=1885902 RepID=A0AB34PFR6_9XANT|nr:hypothetical protein NC00_00680 [Xanthomonas cannabis pv. phaseoli]